uniref:Uncharacterized protein n=1 Tax=Rhizophora mucronata TaxID=61149 RepID=A0A2P2P4W4_RHIMU
MLCGERTNLVGTHANNAQNTLTAKKITTEFKAARLTYWNLIENIYILNVIC